MSFNFQDDDFYLGVLVEAATAPALGVDTEGTEIKSKDNGWAATDYRDGTGFAYGISISYRFNGVVKSYYFPIKHETDNVSPKVAQALKILLERHKCCVFHHAQHDLVALETLNIFVEYFWCTMIMTHMIDENITAKSLEYISQKLLGEGKERSPEFDACLAIFGWTPMFPSQVMALYAATDADRALRCWEILEPEMRRQGFCG